MGDLKFFDNVFETLSAWKSAAEQNATAFKLYVAMDNGATNTRIAFGTEGEFIYALKFQCKSAQTLIARLNDVANELTNKLGDPSQYVVSGVFASAGRLLDNATRVHITNYTEGDEHQYLSLEQLPSSLFPKGRSKILNDLESACYGIAGLNKLGLLKDYFKVYYRKSGPTEISTLPYDNYLVIAVGTGMGVGFLVSLRSQSDFSVIPLEGGHILMSPYGVSHPRYEEELSLFNHTSQFLYQGNFGLEFEDFVSGRGLEYIYNWVIKDKPELSPLPANEISEKARKGECKLAEKALLYHYLYLSRASVNFSVFLQTKGIFWAGDNQVVNSDFVERFRDDIIDEFHSHPKSNWLDETPIFTQSHALNINIQGALHIARQIQ